MAIDYDAISNATPGTGNLSWSHTPVGTPRGVLVYVLQDLGTTDEVTGVTYGGTAMTEVTGSPNLHTTGEPGGVYCYFLGASVPTGAQTVAVTVNATGSTKAAVCITVTAAADTVVQDTDATINSDAVANPTSTLSLGATSCFCAIGFHSGMNTLAGITPTTGWTSSYEYSPAATCVGVYKYDTIGTSDVAAGWTQTSNDAVAIGIAVKEGGASFTVAGTLTTSGTIVKATAKGLAGTLTSSGSLVKASSKLLAGTVTTSGTISTFKSFLLSVAGTLTSTGVLVRATAKTLGGTLTTAGGLVKGTSKGIGGTLTSSGVLVKGTAKVLAGTLTSGGTLARAITKGLAGTLTSSGTLVKATAKGLAGTLTTAGSLVKTTEKVIAGTLTTVGSLGKSVAKGLAGALTTAGTFSTGAAMKYVTVAGTLTSSGVLRGLIDAALPIGTAVTGWHTHVTWRLRRGKLQGKG